MSTSTMFVWLFSVPGVGENKITYGDAMQDPLSGWIKRLTHAISARPARPTLRTVSATNKEVIPRAPCPIVTTFAVLKDTATWKEESRNKTTVMQKSDWKTTTQRIQTAEYVVCGEPNTVWVKKNNFARLVPCFICINSAKLFFNCNRTYTCAAASWHKNEEKTQDSEISEYRSVF